MFWLYGHSHLAARKLQPPRLCVGVHRGEALVGMIGGSRRAEYTAIGPAVSLAEKLAQVAQPGSVTLGAKTAESMPAGLAHQAGKLVLQGESQPLGLVRLSEDAAAILERERQRKSA